jgi:hypothetical protein
MIEYIISMQLSNKKNPQIASTLGHRFNRKYALSVRARGKPLHLSTMTLPYICDFGRQM